MSTETFFALLLALLVLGKVALLAVATYLFRAKEPPIAPALARASVLTGPHRRVR